MTFESFLLMIMMIIIIMITSLPKIIWEEGRNAIKSPLVTMASPKFALKSTPSCGPIP